MAQLSLRSDFSEPLIVMTHRSQWEEAEGILLKYDAFKGCAFNFIALSLSLFAASIPASCFASVPVHTIFLLNVVLMPEPYLYQHMSYLPVCSSCFTTL
jgi:hypothetical protein